MFVVDFLEERLKGVAARSFSFLRLEADSEDFDIERSKKK